MISLHLASAPASLITHLLLLLSLWPAAVKAVLLNFDNCLDPNIVNSSPRQLQFVPLHFDARFNRTESPHTVNITVFGNVSGQANQGPYPGPDSPAWRDPTNSFGKFVDLSTSNNKLSTLFSTFEVLSYVPYRAPPSQFCLSTVNKACPIGPAFGGNSSDPSSLPGFTIAHDFYSSYAFSTIVATVRVQSGDLGAPNLACVSAAVTPELGRELSGTLRYVPAAVLALVGLATVFAALFSPWGSTDPCRWTSNYGRDEDLLRLVTPGFADCLQYIQFAVLLGALSLAYPGFYQPVLSQASWSVLMFNQSLVSHGSGHVSSVDGLYFVNATYGLDSFSQYVGMSSDTDIWACMVIWLLVIALSLFSICQLIFFFRWGYRSLSKSQKQDLRSKNLPFTIGNIVRIVYNYMMLPIIAFSMFQFVIASESPAIVVIMAVVVVVTIIAGACWILRQIFTTSPRAQLFDDLPTLLLYGPLFNTYSDEAAPFALITLLLTLLRGIAIGAVQQSGIAQLVLLAIGEVVYLLTLHAFRPYSRATSMNAYHTVIAIIRLIIILLSITFVPSLGVTEGTRGWVAYAILILHAMILLFAFFLSAVQKVIEVGARLAGAGTEARGPFSRVFGLRQLSSRARGRPQHVSIGSEAAMLSPEGVLRSPHTLDDRSRSLSASSGMLLNHHSLGYQSATTAGTDTVTQVVEYTQTGQSSGPNTPGARSSASYAGGAVTPTAYSYRPPGPGLRASEPLDPYYRPPRPKRPISETVDSTGRTRGSGASGDWANRPYQDSPEDVEGRDLGEGLPTAQPDRGSITPAYFGVNSGTESSTVPDATSPRTDYAVREVDSYYVPQRGSALSNAPARRRTTGPADPNGPVSSATTWFKTLFGGAISPEKSKGFEVVRGRRAPTQLQLVGDDEAFPPLHPEPYRDSPKLLGPNTYSRASTGAASNDVQTSRIMSHQPHQAELEGESTWTNGRKGVQPFSDGAPVLAPIETTDGIELSGRRDNTSAIIDEPLTGPELPPEIPRKSSRRTRSNDGSILIDVLQPSAHSGGPDRAQISSSALQPQHQQQLHPWPGRSATLSTRLPFGNDLGPDKISATGGGGASSLHSLAASATHSTHGPDSGAQEGRAEDASGMTELDRPLSTGYVVHRRAGDGIRPGNNDQESNLGTSAEVVRD